MLGKGEGLRVVGKGGRYKCGKGGRLRVGEGLREVGKGGRVKCGKGGRIRVGKREGLRWWEKG